MTWLSTAAAMLAIFLVTTLVIISYQRSLDKPGGRAGASAMGDVLGGMIEVFDPGQGRSARDLKEFQSKTEIMPSPDPEDPDAPFQVVNDVTGRPAVVRLKEQPQPSFKPHLEH